MTRHNIFLYFKERFPAPGVILISSSAALLALGIWDTPFRPDWPTKVVLITIVFSAFLLRQRIVDEFKDKSHDDKNFPNRPLQRGIVTTHNLILIGITALIVEIIAVLLIGGVESLAWYTPAFIYSLFMSLEFFIGKWLKRHFTCYFLLHEVVLLLFAIWLCYIFDASINYHTLAWVISFTSIMMTLEIGRKFELRKNPRGTIVKDTYLSVWGRTNTLSALVLLILISGISLSYVESSLIFAIVSSTTALYLNIFTKNNRIVKAAILFNMIALILLGLII